MRKKFFFLILFVCAFSNFLFSQDITILYTGSSHSSLYPCGHCPSSVGGGLSRRATVIKEEEKKTSNLLLLDSGNLFASGPLDEFSINPSLDKYRTEVTLRAMEIMGYQAIGIDEEELRLGLGFLKEKIRNTNIPFVSCNLKIKGVTPFLIKKFKDFKVGITGLSSKRLERFKVEVLNYEESLKKVFKEFRKKKVDFIILLSSLDTDQILEILEEFKEIDIVILSKPSLYEGWGKRIGNTLILNPYYQAKKIGKAQITFKEGSIKDYKVDLLPLSLKIREDKNIKEILPSCFQDSDCPQKKDMASICQNPGRNSQCLYMEVEPVYVKLITLKNCQACSTGLSEKLLKRIFKSVKFKRFDYRQPQAKALIKRLGIKTLPAFIFDSKIEEQKDFLNLKQLFNTKENYYILKPQFSGIFYYLDRPFISKRVDLFISFYDKNTLILLKSLKSIAQKEKLSLYIHFIVNEAKRAEVEEYLRTLSIEKLYPDKFWEYLFKRLKNIKSSFWNLTLEGLKIDIKKISDFALSQQAQDLLEKETALAKALGINRGPVILVNNQKIFSIVNDGVDFLEELLKEDN